MTIEEQRKRARIMAVVLAVVAVSFYAAFLFMTANGF
jgi:hypothetical protein